MRGNNIKIVDSKFGIVSKDLSDVQIDNIEIEKSKIGLAAFSKKSEFGPSLIKFLMVAFINAKLVTLSKIILK